MKRTEEGEERKKKRKRKRRRQKAKERKKWKRGRMKDRQYVFVGLDSFISPESLKKRLTSTEI